MVGTGEKQADLEPFHPDRMASRILGMGDVVSLVEKAQQVMDLKDMEEAEEQLLSNRMDFESFLKQLRMFKKLGPLENLLDMIPGGARVPSHVRGSLAQTSTQDMKRAEAIILSMTSEERRKPGVINASRKRRIAAGSGTRVQDVNELLRRFEMAQGMAKNIKQVQKKMTKFGRWRR
jgi:signal recognition particle subunit SRP54